jgi:hypothetical protein
MSTLTWGFLFQGQQSGLAVSFFFASKKETPSIEGAKGEDPV